MDFCLPPPNSIQINSIYVIIIRLSQYIYFSVTGCLSPAQWNGPSIIKLEKHKAENTRFQFFSNVVEGKMRVIFNCPLYKDFGDL